MSVFKFTPDLMSKEQIAAITVGRTGLLSHSVEKIRNAIRDERTINMIFVGPHGIGKSHTVLKLASELESDATLVRLSEEEYSVSSLDEFFARVLDVLGESYDLDIVACARRIFQKYREQGRPVIILAENLQILFSEMSADLPLLRSIILEDHNFFIIGTALYTFEQITSPSVAFYNFFEINRLKGLNTGEINKLIKLQTRDSQSKSSQDSDVVSSDGLRILTGGNPRLVHMLCDIMVQKRSNDSLEQNLMSLLDGLTPFYQTRMEIMPPEKRKVFDTLALSHGPSTPTEIAVKLKLKNTTVTAHLQRLRNDGIVERVKLRPKKETRYQISDRLYRIWREFRTRDGNAKTTEFVRFLELWYLYGGLVTDYESRAFESTLPKNTDGARSGLYTMRCILNEMFDASDFLEDVVAKHVAAKDHSGARSAIQDFRNKNKDEPDLLLSAYCEIVAKNAELLVVPREQRENHTLSIFEDFKNADHIITTSLNRHDDDIVHTVYKIIGCALDMNNIDLADSINNHARACLTECKRCVCFTRFQAEIMVERYDYVNALKPINAILGAKSAYPDMDEAVRNDMIESLLLRMIVALHGGVHEAVSSTAFTDCLKAIKPFVTPAMVSSDPLRFLIERGHGVQRIGRTLDVLFAVLDKEQLGMLRILKSAADYARHADTDSLERLHPEQRELAFDMISKISPDTRIPQEVLDSVK